MVAEAAIASLVRLLGELLIQKVNFLQGVEEKVQLLKDELIRMHSFLRDANKKLAKDETVRNWISDIRELALDAEDTIEMFLLNVENPRSNRGFLQTCACFPKHVYHLDRVGEKIDSILARLEAIEKSRYRYGIGALSGAADSEWRSEVEARRRLAPWEKEEPVGMEDDVKKLLELILDEEKKGLSVTAVVGMGGIGKSTLARMVYNHPDMAGGRFDRRAWVVVSSEFTPEETIKQLILELPRTDREKQDVREEIKKLEESTRGSLYIREKLKELLNKQLVGKNYFIVLDDVWEMAHLDLLRNAFPKEEDKTSRLLLTTRNKVIGDQCQSSHVMMFLDRNKSWELFLKKAFTGKSEEFPKELEPIGRTIVEKCKGLPLAISVMGGLLVDKKFEIEWKEALSEMDSHLGNAESSVSAILELSYLNLSPQLKSCFLCLAFFKEDAIIPVERVARIMVGQGLIHHTDSAGTRKVEDIARRYLDDLINRNMVRIGDLTMDNRVKTCYLHDSLHSLCLRKAKEETGLEILKGDSRISCESSQKPRHWVVHDDYLHTFSINKNKHLRSLFLVGVLDGCNSLRPKTRGPSCWKSFQRLKTLELEQYPSKTFLDCFRFLVGLKQFTIISQQFIELPTWLDRIKKLELIDMKKVRVQFPNVALEMDSLRHIHVYSARGQPSIESWPNIETLKYFRQEDWIRCSSELKDNCRACELGIFVDIKRGIVELNKSLEKMDNLVKLHLAWDSFLTIETRVIPLQLRNLTKLKLTGKMRKCPSVSMLPPVISHLTLNGTNLEDDLMQELGKLPKLLYLKLKKHAYLGSSMQVLRDGFPCLKVLVLKWIYTLRSIQIEEGGMPRLQLLRIQRCQHLDIQSMPQHITISTA